MTKTVIVSGARTPFGKFGGVLSSLTAAELGGRAIKAALERARFSPEQLDSVVMGMVLQGGQGQIPSRQALQEAGIPWQVKTETINKVCASGMRSVTLADQVIRLGEADAVVAGGMESMSNTPYFLPQARSGYRMGDQRVKDMMIHDGLTCSFSGLHMGVYGGHTAKELGITRQAQDEWAYRSHKRAVKAIEAGWLQEEIVALEVRRQGGKVETVDRDEAPRKDTSMEALRQLRPVFDKNGTITAGNAPGVNDGACAMLLMSGKRAAKAGLSPMAVILAHEEVAVEPENFPKTPGLVIKALLKKAGRSLEEIDLFEVNEAFAAVALASKAIAGIDLEKVNVNGGAVALGHPIGASGARIILTLIYELKRRGGGLGMAAICSGGGQGDAVLIEVPREKEDFLSKP